MSRAMVTIPTRKGDVEIALAQLETLRRLEPSYRDPVWHLNDCGCCVSIHERDDHSCGHVIGPDGEADFVEEP